MRMTRAQAAARLNETRVSAVAPANDPPSGVFAKPARKPATRIAWFVWKKKDGKATLPHAFRVFDGTRAPKSLCHNSPGHGCEDFREVSPGEERCTSCDDAMRKSIPRGAAAGIRRPQRPDPRTLYEPTHTFDDWVNRG